MKEEYSPYKIVHHIDKIQELKEGKQTVPLQVQLIPSNKCNQKCSFCFPKDTLIYTTAGKVPIQQIVVGHQVYDINGNTQSVTETYDRYYKGNVKKITFVGYDIDFRVTPEHPIFVEGKDFIEAGNVKVGDKVRYPLPKAESFKPVDVIKSIGYKLSSNLKFKYNERVKGNILVEVKSIEDVAYEGMVYNFAVENTETYIANGILVHNCAYRMPDYLSNQNFEDQDVLSYEKIIETLDCFVDMGVKACQFSVHGDECIPVIKDGVMTSERIGEFIDGIFDHEYVEGYEELDISDKKIQSYAIDDEGNLIQDDITHIYRHKSIEPLYEITLHDGRQTVVTASHSLNVVRDNKIQKIKVSDITTDDVIACADIKHSEVKPRKFSIEKSNYKNANNINDVVECPELFRLLGYFVSEGSFNVKYGITFTFGTGELELKFVNDVVDISKKIFGYVPSVYDEGNKTTVKFNSVEVNRLFRMFFNLTPEQSCIAKYKFIPSIVWSASKENKYEFITGLYCGDGNVRNTSSHGKYQRNVINLKTASKRLADETFMMLKQLGCFPTLSAGMNKERKIEGRTLKPSKYYVVGISNKVSMQIMEPIVLKMGKCLGYVDSVHSGNFKREFKNFGNESYLVGVKKIRIADELGLPLVYDITVKNTHRFVLITGVGTWNTGGGESLVHPNIKGILKETFDRNLEVSMVTNGMAMDDDVSSLLKNAKWVRVSLDAATPEVYSMIRKVSPKMYYKTIDNIKNLISKKGPVTVGIGFVVNKENYHEVYDACVLAKSLGVDNFRISAAFTPMGFKYFENFMEEAKALSKKCESLGDDNFTVFNLFGDRVGDTFEGTQDYDNCPIKDLLTYIGADGNVYTCCTLAYNDSGYIGSIKDQSFKDLWNSPEKIEMFKNHNPSKRCQHPCMYKGKNDFINYCIKKDPKHVNYI